MKFRTLPLGIDAGRSRVRIALAETAARGEVRIRAIAARDLPMGDGLFAALLDEMLEELGTRERRCVISLGEESASLRVITMPAMSWAERGRAARFEARRFTPWELDGEPTVVRVHPSSRVEGRWAIGAVRRVTLEERIGAYSSAGLRVCAIDHDSLALRRAHPAYDAVLDVGFERATIHCYGEGGPRSWSIAEGGAQITRGIARDLSIDEPSAERRKRILGTAGAGISARDGFVAALREAVVRARGRVPISSIALTGNGARLPGLVAAIEAATGARVEIPVSALLPGEMYPDDVLRAAAPDWALAAALSIWQHAA